MKAFNTPILLLSALALQACSMQQASVEATTSATLDKPSTITPQTFVMRGEIVVGHEARTFTPCGSNQQYWLALTPEQAKQALVLSRSPYQPMYGEVVGYLAAPKQIGLDADYNARLEVKSINLLSAENPKRCNQPLKPTRAFGNEPSWSASFDGNAVIFQTISGEKQQLPITQRQLSTQQRDYQFENGSLQLKQQACNDGMSDSFYGWRSSLTLDGKTYKGCATLGNSDPTLQWVGVYQAASTQNNNFSVSLQLNADHSATTSYDYNNGDPSMVEKGFWQQLNDKQVHVVMTRHQRQYLLAERIFTRNGNQIQAEKEKVGDIIYPISNGGLTLFTEDLAQ